MFRCYNYTIIREHIDLCLLKLHLVQQSIKIHRCVVNTVVAWLHILGPYRCMCVALFGSRLLPKGATHHHRINHTPIYFNGLFFTTLTLVSTN